MLVYNSSDAAYKAAMTYINHTHFRPSTIRALPANFSKTVGIQFVVCNSTSADAEGNVWNNNDYPVAIDLNYVETADEDYYECSEREWFKQYMTDGYVENTSTRDWGAFLGLNKPLGCSCDDCMSPANYGTPVSFTPPPTKILILGHGRHGKDTVAEILEGMLGFKFISSSYACLQVIKPLLLAARPEHLTYATDEEIYEDRINCRDLWKEAITLVNTPDKSHLAKLVLEQADTYVGMRCNQEFLASKDLFDLVIWVDAFERIPDADPTMDIEYDPSYMVRIDNNGGLDALGFQLGLLAMKQGWVDDEDV